MRLLTIACAVLFCAWTASAQTVGTTATGASTAPAKVATAKPISLTLHGTIESVGAGKLVVRVMRNRKPVMDSLSILQTTTVKGQATGLAGLKTGDRVDVVCRKEGPGLVVDSVTVKPPAHASGGVAAK